uniref:Peptidase M20 dimerisation domain-containing protein n=2 Tax=Caenorhabditis japonica TaxID=281687 RepID=A0A8R1ICX3_CAEJA
MDQIEAVFKAIDEQQDEFIELLRESVAIQSVSADPARRDDCIRMSSWARDQLRSLGVETSLWDLGNQKLPSGQELPLPPAVFGVFVYGMAPDFTREGGSIPVTLTIQNLTKRPVMLLPIGASDDMAHSQNEKINRDNFVKGMKVLAAYIFELAS